VAFWYLMEDLRHGRHSCLRVAGRPRRFVGTKVGDHCPNDPSLRTGVPRLFARKAAAGPWDGTAGRGQFFA
jgi:hypothetical protein